MSTRALAICYRSTSGGVEVVLVRSRRGLWTIPGRPIDPGDTPEHAAIRELREEAGITGGSVAAPVAYVPVIKNVGDLLLPRVSDAGVSRAGRGICLDRRVLAHADVVQAARRSHRTREGSDLVGSAIAPGGARRAVAALEL